ncbi:MAG: glycosyltransferase family 1 protein [Candidatus Hydrogenedentes bacterium]|nr:glycosyltransferase family 1 protein [Candidatus Hydrogenedentota bacterium]
MTSPGDGPVDSSNLRGLLPMFIRRLLIVPAGRGEIGYLLRRERGIEVHGFETRPECLPFARACLDSVTADVPDGAPPFTEACFDALLVPETESGVGVLRERLRLLACTLKTGGWLLVRAPAPVDAPEQDAAGQHFPYEGIVRTVQEAGFGLYNRWPVLVPAPSGSASEYLLLFVRPEYDPLAQAEHLFDAGHPDWAFEVLAHIPAVYLQDEDVRINVRAQMHLCLLAWLKQRPDLPPLDHFDKAQELFHQLVADRPDFAPAYQCQAEFWRLLDDTEMAARLLRSAQHAAPTDTVRRQLGAILSRSSSRAWPGEEAPLWTDAEAAGPHRMLLVTHPRPHYGLDVLYDGLCSVLGEDNVMEFPYKPSLHGEGPEEYKNYPCAFDRAGNPTELSEILDRLKSGWFDVVLYGDCEAFLERETARAIANAARSRPLFIVDALDAALNLRPRVMEHLGLSSVAGYFKREMLRCADYGPNAFPLPFAYPDSRVSAPPGVTPRSRPFFWAGHRQSGLRRLFLERIEARLGVTLSAGYPQEQYLTLLRESRIGLNCFGFGFDTVRYWEIPAHGAMLFSERLPIRIPHDFTDGENAVFFSDLEEMERKFNHYLASPAECARIASGGHEHLLRYHTGSMRARQCLGWIVRASRT